MYAQCSECKQHFDDTAQTDVCDGFNYHKFVRERPITEHNHNVRATQTNRARSKARSYLAKGSEDAVNAPSAASDVSTGTDTHPTEKDAPNDR